MITMAVLVCLLVITLIAGGLIRLVHSQRQRIRIEERQLQADWLAESGLERAAARLSQDPGYRGETWKLPAEVLGGPDAGLVTITVEPLRAEAKADRRLVTIQADYPTELPRRIRARKQAALAVAVAGADAW
jgi:hypothetical protein